MARLSPQRSFLILHAVSLIVLTCEVYCRIHNFASCYNVLCSHIVHRASHTVTLQCFGFFWPLHYIFILFIRF